MSQNRGDAWSHIVYWHTLRERFVREVVYPAERCAVTKIMKEVPGLVVTTSMLRKLLGGQSKEIPSRTEGFWVFAPLDPAVALASRRVCRG